MVAPNQNPSPPILNNSINSTSSALTGIGNLASVTQHKLEAVKQKDFERVLAEVIQKEFCTVSVQ